ncbi:caldesmon-like [Alosa sapidissima]|uniref:caldesmon-like n=1 Tax=Alosa sapidissima TaxID=34773 RepID=UPI001C09B124|nr:caldesmon-like [Alosa sapidissima]
MRRLEESWRLLFEAKAFQERAWLESRIEAKMEEMHSLILADVEWKMHSFMKLLMEQERRAGTGLTSALCISWAMSPEDRARLERWEREEEEVRERRRQLKEAWPSVSLQKVDIRQAFHPDPRVTEARLREEKEVRMTAEQWKAIENEKRKKEEVRREIRERSAKLDQEKLQEDRKALEVEWKNLEKEKRKIEEERKEMERQAKVQEQLQAKFQEQQLEEKRRESEAREREDALRKKALTVECEKEKIGIERMKIEVVLKEVETQKEQLLEKRKKLKEKVVRERRTVATDKQRLKEEWEKVEEEKKRMEKERRELEQKEEELQGAQEIEKKQREYKALMREMEKEKQKTEKYRKELMVEKAQQGNKEGEKESDEVKQNMEITETVIKQEKAVEVAQGKAEKAEVPDDNSWDSDESNRGEPFKPKAKCNIALMKAGSQESPVKELPKPAVSAQDNEDDSWDSDEEVIPTKATRAPTTQRSTLPLKPGSVCNVPVKNTCTKKQSKALNDAELFDKELKELEREMEVKRKTTPATNIQKAAVPMKALVDPELLDKELEELEKKLTAGPSNRKPTVAKNIQKATVPVKQGDAGSVAVQKKPCPKKQSKALDDEFSDDLFNTDLEEKKATRKPAKEHPDDTDAIVRELEKLNEELKDPKGSMGSLYSQRDKRAYEWKHKDYQHKFSSKGMTGSNLTGVKTPETKNQKVNSPLFPRDAIHLKYLKGRRF